MIRNMMKPENRENKEKIRIKKEAEMDVESVSFFL